MRRWVSFSAAVGVASGITSAALFVAACATGPSAGEASLTLDGQVQLTSSSRRGATTADGGKIQRGTTVKLLRGAGTLEFGDGRRIEMRRGTAVKVDAVPAVTSGDALLVSDGVPFRVKAAGTTFSITDGAARVTRGLGVEASAYRGAITITSAGRKMSVGALRRATIAALGVLPNDVEPVRMRSTDAWDRRFLGDAMELTEQLQARSDGITGQLANDRAGDITFFTDVLPMLQRNSAIVASLLDTARAPGETLVGATIAAEADGGSFAERWRGVFEFRDAGAAWGLVALDQRLVDANRLSSTLDLAFTRAQSFTVQVIAATRAADEAAAQTASVGAESTETIDSTPTQVAEPAQPASPPPAEQPAPEVQPAPKLIPETVDTVETLVSGLLGALGGKG